MKKNVGGVDRMIRLILGVAIGAYGAYAQSWLGLIAIIPLGTALISSCPLYLGLGLSTCARDKGTVN